MKVNPSKLPLKTCFFVERDTSARWVTDFMNQLLTDGTAEISHIYQYMPEPPGPRPYLLRILDSISIRLLFFFENRLYRHRKYALDPSSLQDFAGEKGIDTSILHSQSDLKVAATSSKIPEYDMIIHLERFDRVLDEQLYGRSRFIDIRCSGCGIGIPPGLPEVGSDSGIIQSEIMVNRADGGDLLSYRVISAVNPTAYFATVHNHFRRLSHFLSELVKGLYESGDSVIDPYHFQPHTVPVTAKSRYPGTPAYYVCRYYLRKIGKWFLKLLFYEQWVLLFAEENWDKVLENPSVLKMIRPPGKTGWADPFILEHENNRFLLFEEIPEGRKKGHLNMAEFGNAGVLRNDRIILEKEFHLSFPSVFSYRDEWFMIPESSAGRTIDLYRCFHFPDTWTFSRTLIPGIEAHDTSLIRYQGKFWLFTTIKKGDHKWNYDDLYIFHSDDLHGDQWIPHPLNPVISDPRSGRNAGRLFIHNDKLFRVAQNCSHYYGYGIEVFGIDTLDEQHYAEHHINSLKPFKRRIAGIHTINHGDHCTVMDARIWQFRWRFPVNKIRLRQRF